MRSKMKKSSTIWLVLCLVVGAACGAVLAYSLGEKNWLTARMYVYVGATAGGILCWLFGSKER